MRFSSKCRLFLTWLVVPVLFLLEGIYGTPISSDSDLLVVGGSEATPHEFPWLASLHWAQGQFCQGVIISTTVVLTTASCASLTNTFYLQIYAGLHRLSQNTSIGVQKRNPLSIRLHPNYLSGPNQRENDIGIIQISATAPFIITEYVAPIRLPVLESDSATVGTVAGWGSAAEESIQLEDILHKAELQILRDDQCGEIYGDEFRPDTMLCGGGNGDFCNGDIGAPLIVGDEQGVPVLVGIASWGQGCGNPFYPGVYTQVSAYLDFINPNI